MLTDEVRIAIKQICAEKNIPEESVIETIESALAAAYRKDYGDKNQNIKVELDMNTGQFQVFDIKEVVADLTEEELAAIEELRKEREELREQGVKPEDMPLHEEIRRFNPKTELELKEAKQLKKTAKIGDILKTELEVPGDFGRMAAQTAKQVIIQRLREAERNVLYQDFKEKEGQLLNGIIQKREGPNFLIDVDHVTVIMPPDQQVRSERYRIGERIKVYVVSVSLTTKGPEIIVSRNSENFVKKLFQLEIPEVASGIIDIKGIAREAGSRSKVAVFTDSDSIDPIGSCVGQKGARIQTIIGELNGEKIDIIKFENNPSKYIANALLPAKISSINLDEKIMTAKVTVPGDQLSLTIGRDGQNVRLASKLTGWRINIVEQESGKEIKAEQESPKQPKEIQEQSAKEVEENNETEPQEEKAKKKTKAEKKDKTKKKSTK
ncbi:MAG: transcription termination factor NusA [Patescibacteria group bacterium]